MFSVTCARSTCFSPVLAGDRQRADERREWDTEPIRRLRRFRRLRPNSGICVICVICGLGAGSSDQRLSVDQLRTRTLAMAMLSTRS